MPAGSPPLPELVLATSNPGKLREFRALLGEFSVELRTLDAFPEVRLPEEADDSGIEVSALGGAPGPRSARFGGTDLDDAGRVEKLLADLAASALTDRSARFVCVAALALPGGEGSTARGECAGWILDAPRGGRGFGYDPIFEVERGGSSMAELPPAEKNRISHRARALSALREVIRERVAT